MRKRANYINVIKQGDLSITEHHQKAKVLFWYFVKLVGIVHEQKLYFDYVSLYEGSNEQMSTLHNPITLQELTEAIDKMPANKALGLDGYT